MQTHLDRARRKIASDLVRRRRHCLQQHQSCRGIERRDESFGESAGVLAARLSGYQQLVAKALNVRGEFHVSHNDARMAQCQVPYWLRVSRASEALTDGLAGLYSSI